MAETHDHFVSHGPDEGRSSWCDRIAIMEAGASLQIRHAARNIYFAPRASMMAGVFVANMNRLGVAMRRAMLIGACDRRRLGARGLTQMLGIGRS